MPGPILESALVLAPKHSMRMLVCVRVQSCKTLDALTTATMSIETVFQ